jgi:GTP pyrophosphokinase
MNIDEIYDISALRVIVETTEECYQVLGIIHQLWQPIPGRLKDYIANPKYT